jgi:lipopolysaccharide biosynthesis glycosyltransferase
MTRHAVCYTATAGYLFQTVLSALQARSFTGKGISVCVCYLGDDKSDELYKFGQICKDNDIEIISAPLSLIDGLNPQYARLFLDKLLPPSVEEILYLDGDTQIVQDITALVEATPPADGALAVRDPMVFIRRTDATFRRKIDAWWDSSGMPDDVRGDYVNSGVIRISRSDIGPLREEVLRRFGGRLHTLHFADQDAINIALQGRLTTISMSWNFPGFLLGTQLVDLAQPRIIHFMSNPRPWNAALPPWGATHHQPYRRFVLDYPEIADYWKRLTGRHMLKYLLQQQYKWLTERRAWQSSDAALAFRDLENSTRQLV